ncbi:fluoride efflux transporter FluC [Natrialbaceae archaeon AArc-T1-2]|uniref:fluoride efflux transporter FluC n=1 Tax=Natrialbaceae archaeon AArc-T1-2 TaxID=3053904 RepID=UPI00255ADDF2|nr:CrcB family protein [Natrialbaceae archaeon AArc-T1-2]WIV68623.1 CrcB family protein [Natrialbaceae archaeon AArc-T1-2]
MSRDHPLVRLETLALIAVGAFAGANLRYAALGELPDVQAILLVNVLGSAILGFLAYEAQYAGLLDRRANLVFTTGFLSSLTTYSTFAAQVALAGGPLETVAVVAGNYGLGIAGVLVGRELARRISGGDRP